ncbi:MAG: hypothetical protein Q4B08_12675 [Propionibacteriaceae bacterium]|nr:hypothetical protein [Propionibacteriaceae bacterium]
MIGLVEDLCDSRIVPTQFGKLVEVLTAMAREDDAVGWLCLDPGKEDPLTPQRTTLGGKAGVVVCQHFR